MVLLSRLVPVIEPHYPRSGKRGRPPIGCRGNPATPSCRRAHPQQPHRPAHAARQILKTLLGPAVIIGVALVVAKTTGDPTATMAAVFVMGVFGLGVGVLVLSH